jgi:hypothetical protein
LKTNHKNKNLTVINIFKINILISIFKKCAADVAIAVVAHVVVAVVISAVVVNNVAAVKSAVAVVHAVVDVDADVAVVKLTNQDLEFFCSF